MQFSHSLKASKTFKRDSQTGLSAPKASITSDILLQTISQKKTRHWYNWGIRKAGALGSPKELIPGQEAIHPQSKKKNKTKQFLRLNWTPKLPATLIIALPAAPIQRIEKILQVYFLIHKMGLIVISPLNVVVMDTGNHYHSEKKNRNPQISLHQGTQPKPQRQTMDRGRAKDITGCS